MNLKDKIEDIKKELSDLSRLASYAGPGSRDYDKIRITYHKRLHRLNELKQQYRAEKMRGIDDSKYKPRPKPRCECGACHTSHPNIHSDWCPEYRAA